MVQAKYDSLGEGQKLDQHRTTISIDNMTFNCSNNQLVKLKAQFAPDSDAESFDQSEASTVHTIRKKLFYGQS